MDIGYICIVSFVVCVLVKHQRRMVKVMNNNISLSSSSPSATVRIKATSNCTNDEELEEQTWPTRTRTPTRTATLPSVSQQSNIFNPPANTTKNERMIKFLIQCLVISGILSILGAILNISNNVIRASPFVYDLLFSISCFLGALAYTNGGLFLVFVQVLFQ